MQIKRGLTRSRQEDLSPLMAIRKNASCPFPDTETRPNGESPGYLVVKG